MPLVVTTIFFVIVIALISVVRKRLVFEISAVSILLFRNSKPGLILYSIFSFPGTVLHELSHWIIAEILQVQTGEINLLPDLNNDSQQKRLGSVMTAHTDPVRGFLIGIAPFAVGIFTLYILDFFLIFAWTEGVWWQITLALYAMIVVGNSMLISREDRKYWPIIGVIMLLVVIISSQLNFTISISFQNWISGGLYRINLVLLFTLVLNLILFIMLYGVRYGLQKLTRKIVITKRRTK